MDREDGVLVEFSDGTTSGYVVEELLELRPFRELASAPENANHRNPLG
jgi:hypothetical protein